MEEHELRHPDHRHEFTEDEFAEFCKGHASRFGYEVEMDTIGEKSRDLGAPTLLGIFKKCE